MTDKVQLLGVSNAIVDVLAQVSHEFLEEIGSVPGSMNLIDEQQARDIYAKMGPAMEKSGGSVANTVAAFANLGGRAAYIGRVADDQLGEVFVHDLQSLGVDVRCPRAAGGAPTARSYILVTPDGQRTMHTYLGACVELDESDISEESVGVPRVALFEGYLWDAPHGPAAIRKAIDIARESDTEVALSLSDSFCVERHRDAFLEAVNNDVDIVIADDSEALALFGSATLDEALDEAAALGNLFAVTCSADGSVIVRGKERYTQKAYPVTKIVDSTGAGDAYAAGFLYGYVTGRSLEASASLGSWCGATVIQQLGARFQSDNVAQRLDSL